MPGRRGRAMPGRFAETVGLDESFEKKISWEESRPWRGNAGQVARPGGFYARQVARQECEHKWHLCWHLC